MKINKSKAGSIKFRFSRVITTFGFSLSNIPVSLSCLCWAFDTIHCASLLPQCYPVTRGSGFQRTAYVLVMCVGLVECTYRYHASNTTRLRRVDVHSNTHCERDMKWKIHKHVPLTFKLKICCVKFLSQMLVWKCQIKYKWNKYKW